MERIHFYVMKIIFVVFVAQTVGYNMIPTTTDSNKNDMNIAYFGPSFRICIGSVGPLRSVGRSADKTHYYL